MPYKIRQEGSQYCVHKENADGSIGEKVACHASQSMAEDQMKALYAAEVDKSVSIEIEIEKEDEEPENEFGFGTIVSEMGYKQKAEYIENLWNDSVKDTIGETDVIDVFDGYLIYKGADGCYMVSYSIVDNDILFDTKTIAAVEQRTQWMTKSIRNINPLAVKSLGEGRIGGYAILWGNESQKDLDGQYFTKETEDLLTVFKAMGKIPWLVQHATDDVIKSVPVAEVTTLEPDESGLWFEAKVIAHDLYKNYVSRLINAGKLFSSVGALPASVKSEKTGFISRFAVVELSGTWSPADPHQVINGYSVSELKTHYDKLGIDSTGLFDDEPSVEIDIIDQQDAEEAAEIDIDQELRELAQNWLNLQKLQVEF